MKKDTEYTVMQLKIVQENLFAQNNQGTPKYVSAQKSVTRSAVRAICHLKRNVTRCHSSMVTGGSAHSRLACGRLARGDGTVGIYTLHLAMKKGGEAILDLCSSPKGQLKKVGMKRQEERKVEHSC